MDTMMQYVKEVQSVQKKLSECVDAIGFINEVLLRSYIWLCALWFWTLQSQEFVACRQSDNT